MPDVARRWQGEILAQIRAPPFRTLITPALFSHRTPPDREKREILRDLSSGGGSPYKAGFGQPGVSRARREGAYPSTASRSRTSFFIDSSSNPS